MATALICAAAICANAATKVACVGNSITFGMKIADRETNSYPSQLQRMLGDGYEVGNFGHSGATLLNRGHNPYMKLPEFRQALDFRPDIVVVHLGVNDTDPRNWPDFGDGFVRDYLALIDSFKVVNPSVRVILANISPVNATHKRFRSGTRDWRLEVRDAVERVARASGSELIDFETPLLDRRDL
ncbi:MAG: GDSL-type esterase/lipase family protein, partial [Alistipes timonensis]|nr:GDSL-type esterase/lipase family protein [Alistipes timonensis]